ncbi:MAG: ArsR family transcriptional regulator [Planctomycetes bacterium]|nr:ArsR family transcriptional regulator [Planctomycetota bacterium]
MGGKRTTEKRAGDRVLYLLKTKGAQTAAKLATPLGVTPMAVRQQLALLAEAGLVSFEDRRRKVGRPARWWSAAAAADRRFPDGHAELALGMLAAARAAFGEAGVARLVAERVRAQALDYGERLPGPGTPLERRVAALAAIRRDEGYLAEATRGADGVCLLVENHCPVCAAARVCAGLCSGELELFRTVLGSNVTVERTEHLLAGSRRCVYRIAPA